MKQIYENWRRYLVEDDPRYFQKIYKIILRIYISKEKGGDKGQTQQDIRAIPDVLTVVSVRGRQKELPNRYLSDMEIRFRASSRGLDPKMIVTDLKKRCLQIKSVFRVDGPYEIVDVSRKT